ncbi:S-layer homology domain-containing protein [Paenibacillus sp. PL2-23]|uniref:S-layer homology domain-containing protein n=1 Tax=Paenibacillus sp. PL2-23 TaxID=2100729 RepID=UPI0030FB6D58
MTAAWRRKTWKQWLSAVTASAILLGAMAPQASYAEEAAGEAVSAVPPILITELVPDTTNVSGVSSDAYEFIEIYNNTDKELDLSQYKLFYRYPDKGPADDVEWPTAATGSVMIPVGGTIVLWVINAANKALTESDFNTNFGVHLTEGENLFRLRESGGMANGAARDLVVKNVLGNDIVIASYQNDEQTKPDKGIFYAYPNDGSNNMRMLDNPGTEAATPGSVTTDQVPEEPVQAPDPILNVPPAIGDIQHVQAESGLEVSATITDADLEVPAATLHYRMASQSEYTAVAMLRGEEGSAYSAWIPNSVLAEETIYYYIEAKDASSQTVSDEMRADIVLGEFDPQSASPLLITELVPDSANIGSGDGYEFVEVYNNTDQPLSLKDYRIRYRYTDYGPSTDVIWPTSREDIVIPSGQAVVFWVINSHNTAATAADFNTNYGTSLQEDVNLFRMYSDGMANGGKRGMVLATNSGIEVSAAYYENDDETKANMGIFYRYPLDGTPNMIKYSAGIEAATPGAIAPGQVPVSRVTVTADTVHPVITDLTAVTTADQSASFDIVAAASDDKQVKTVLLYYKDDRESEYNQRYLTQSYSDTLFRQTIFSPQLIARSYMEYYFEVSDGTNSVTTMPKRVTITGGPEQAELRLNVEENEVLSGTSIIRGAGADVPWSELDLSLDGEALTTGTYAALESGAYFAFETMGVNYYFKNAVVMDGEIIHTFLDPIESWSTLSIPISADELQEGSNVISIYAGSKSGPFDDRPEENKDDFEIRNVRLVLADGTELYDPSYASPMTSLKMGDSAGKHEHIDFAFTLTADKLAAKAYAWDTRNEEDGEHTITLEHESHGTLDRIVRVDNTAPVIQSMIEDGEEYRGEFVIDAVVTDAIAGVEVVEALLDGEPIELPYATSSATLHPGSHTFEVKAGDAAGNEAAVVVTFSVPDENPNAPTVVAPLPGTANVGSQATLSVNVQDPLNDLLRVSFFRGYSFDATSASAGFAAYSGAADTEPPKQEVPGGETGYSAEDYERIREADKQYLVNDATEQFPYHRFEIRLDPSVKDTDRVAVSWQGHSLEGRKVSLYAWNPGSMKWDQLDTHIAGNEDFELGAEVLAGEYRNGDTNQMNLMVQDELPVSNDPYDFSFVWMSDTQYYSESYPEYFRDNVRWIKENLDSHKIRYVIHTGDLVDESDEEYQWREADMNMKVLDDAGIPYGVLAGNHDVDHAKGTYDEYWKWFGEQRFVDQPTFGGSYNNNMGHYDLISAGGNDFIIVYMGWGLADREIEWMNQVVKAHPNRKAILALHEYLLVSGNRAPIADKVYEEVVLPNPNVFATLSGHYHDAELKTDAIDDNQDGIMDRKVYQMLADYQGAERGGLGYIRLMQFDMANDKLHIKTYSPTLDDYNYYDPVLYPGKDEFSLDLELDAQTKRVATDYFGVQVFTDAQIGETQTTESGGTAVVRWTGLAGNASYEWYAVAEDPYKGMGRSNVWRFYTGEGEAPVLPLPSLPVDPKPQPEVTGGVISLQPNASGQYELGAAALQEAIAGAEGETFIEIKLGQNEASSNQAAEVRLPAAAIADLRKSGKGLQLAASGLTVQYPVQALPAEVLEQAGDATVAWRIGSELTAAVKQAMQQSQQGAAGLSGSDIVFTLELVVTSGDGTSTKVHELGGKVRVSRMLSEDERRLIDPDYAGVYYLDGGRAIYMGGTFENGEVAFETDHFSDFAVMEYRRPFDDIVGHWAQPFVGKLAAKHVVTGVAASMFAPERAVKRADFAVMAVKALGHLELEAAGASFADVAAGSYYAAYVEKAYELGLVTGYQNHFRPEDAISREEAAVILMRLYALLQGEAAAEADGQGSFMFADLAVASDWAQDAIEAAAALGLVSGKGDGMFDPHADVKRAELAKMIWLALSAE